VSYIELHLVKLHSMNIADGLNEHYTIL